MYKVPLNVYSLQQQKLHALTRSAEVLQRGAGLSVIAASAQRENYVRKASPLPHSIRAFVAQKVINRSTQRLLAGARATSNTVTRATNTQHARAARLMQQAERSLSA